MDFFASDDIQNPGPITAYTKTPQTLSIKTPTNTYVTQLETVVTAQEKILMDIINER